MNKAQKAFRALQLFAQGKPISPNALARIIDAALHEDAPRESFADAQRRKLREAEQAVKNLAAQRARAAANNAPTVQGQRGGEQ